MAVLAIAGAVRASIQPATDIHAEVRRNILEQPIGGHRVADLALPDGFVDQLADRIVRSSYRERQHVVLDDTGSDVAPPAGGGGLGPVGITAIAAGLLVGLGAIVLAVTRRGNS